MDKFIFLDIDGVLNSEQFYEEKTHKERFEEFRKEFEDYVAFKLADIDSKAVKLLNKLTDISKAKIVVSSSWRSIPNLELLFKYVGIKESIFGKTPYLDSRYRGKEINEWLKNIKEPYKYVILDDDNDMLEEQLNNFIQTDWRKGLTDKDVTEAIKILSDD